MKRWKLLTVFGIVLWGVLFGASKVHAEEVVEIPEEIQFWCEYYGEQYGICPEVLEAMAWTESRCIPSAQSPDHKYKGLMQINVPSHIDRMERLGVKNIFGVLENLKVGTDFLSELLEEEHDIAPALARFNGQSASNVEKARNGEYEGYVKEVLEIAEELERRKGK